MTVQLSIFLKKFHTVSHSGCTRLPFDLVIPLLGIYPRNPETPIQKNLCTPMFMALLFTIAKCWQHPKCPSVNQWIKKTVVPLPWLVWLSGLSTGLRTKRVLVRFPVRAYTWVAGHVPQCGVSERQPHIDVFVLLFSLPSPL